MPESSIYDRIGGAASVKAAVDLFYRRILADPELAPFFANVNLERLKRHQFAFLSHALGGPVRYTGAQMSQAHAHLAIEQRHFDAVASHLAQTLRALGVDDQSVQEILAAIAPLAGQIVNTRRGLASD